MQVLHMGLQRGHPNRLGINRHVDKLTDKEIDRLGEIDWRR
jgi:hypothetical protein